MLYQFTRYWRDEFHVTIKKQLFTFSNYPEYGGFAFGAVFMAMKVLKFGGINTTEFIH
jgi:hypothetical protein